jgi:hypothetical protein
MKAVARQELEKEMYSVVEEPLYPPARWMSWETYRPDLLGYKQSATGEQVAIVECETRPNTRRVRSKNYASLWFQPTLYREGSIRRILAVPRGKLGSLDLRLRSDWEIWVLGGNGLSLRLPRLT